MKGRHKSKTEDPSVLQLSATDDWNADIVRALEFYTHLIVGAKNRGDVENKKVDSRASLFRGQAN